MTALLVDGKVCTACGVHKPVEGFYRKNTGRLGRQARCKDCVPAKTAEQVRVYNLKSFYGMTAEEYDARVKAQQGRCAICQEVPTGKGMASRLHVDHCHDSKRVRELLCQRCNVGLGCFRDNPEALARAIEYLAAHS